MTDKQHHEYKFKSLLERAQSISFVELMATITVVVLLVAIFMLYEARTAFIQHYVVADVESMGVPTGTTLQLSDNSKEQIEAFTHEHGTLALVAVIGVDLSDNTRSALIRFYNDKAIEKLALTNDKKARLGVSSPLFTDNAVNNAEISALLNGEFTCTSVDSSPFIVVNNLTQTIKQVCRVPVPPYYGRLTGYLVMYSKTEMSIYEVDQLRSAAIRLAIDIYRADVARLPRYERPMRSR